MAEKTYTVGSRTYTKTELIRNLQKQQEKERQLPTGDLTGTLTGDDKQLGTSTIQGLSLPSPDERMGQLDLLRLALRDVTQNAYQSGLTSGFKGVEGKLGEMGLGAEQVRPSSSAGIIDFVESRVQEPVTRMFDTASFLVTSMQNQIEREKERATSNLNLLLSQPGALSQIDMGTLSSVASNAGVPLGILTTLKQTQEANLKFEQEMQDKSAEADIEQQVELERRMKAEGLGRYYQAPVVPSTNLLSVTEAEKLRVPFGTTEAEAAAMGITPAKAQTEKQQMATIEAQTKMGNLDWAIQKLEDGKVSTGPLTGVKSWLRRKPGIGEGTGDQIEFESILGRISAKEMFGIGGKVLPSQEISRLEKFIPELGTQEADVLVQLKAIRSELQLLWPQHFPETQSFLQTPKWAEGGGGFTVNTPDGETYSFPSQQAANAFKTEIGQ